MPSWMPFMLTKPSWNGSCSPPICIYIFEYKYVFQFALYHFFIYWKGTLEGNLLFYVGAPGFVHSEVVKFAHVK